MRIAMHADIQHGTAEHLLAYSPVYVQIEEEGAISYYISVSFLRIIFNSAHLFLVARDGFLQLFPLILQC
jgi:hypothetical protein